MTDIQLSAALAIDATQARAMSLLNAVKAHTERTKDDALSASCRREARSVAHILHALAMAELNAARSMIVAMQNPEAGRDE